MEDSHLACTEIPVGNRTLDRGHSIFGVFDGHGGDFTSDYAAKNFIKAFSTCAALNKYSQLTTIEQYSVPGISMLKTALTEAFCELDHEIRKKQSQRNYYRAAKTTGMERVRQERSGSTIVVVMITPSHIICANAGDSRAVLHRDGRALPLSFDHKPSNLPELERITSAGGFVKSKRIDGDLAVSRGLGDFSYKSIDGLPIKDQKVIPQPEFVVYPRAQQDEFVILACDGIWDVATNEECTELVNELLEEGEADLGLICEEALDTCLDKNSRDNMTFAIVTFDAAKTSRSMAPNGAVWKRRTVRQVRQLEKSAKIVAFKAVAGAGINLKAVTVGGGIR
jgi:serine/threonine protein phosphatase PrpC